MSSKELKNWLEEYRINLLSLMGEDDYTTGKLDVIRQVLDKLNQRQDMSKDQLSKLLNQEKEWTAMFDSDVRVGLALLDEIRKLNQNKEDETIPS
jgi:exonuclease III